MAAEIECPKCGFRQDGGSECLQCGIVFSRMHRSANAPVSDAPMNSGARSLRERFGQYYRIFRWVSLCVILGVAGLILHDSQPPEAATNPDAVQQARDKVREFQSTIHQGREGTLAMDESVLNGWLDTNLVLRDSGDSSSSPSQEQESDIYTIDTTLEEYEFDEDAIEEAKSSIRDIRVELLGDTLRLYAIFDTYGIDLSLELEGRIRVEDGYLRLDPIGGKLGSLPLPSGTLQSATKKLFESPENREKFRLPPYIRDMKIDGSQLIVSSQEARNTLR